jgi:hypothetical protein
MPVVFDATSTSTVKLLLPTLKSRSISPFPLFAGIPPVDTIVSVPAVAASCNRLFTACVELPSVLFTVVVLVYVMTVVVLVE